jgi:hypothetical protein
MKILLGTLHFLQNLSPASCDIVVFRHSFIFLFVPTKSADLHNTARHKGQLLIMRLTLLRKTIGYIFNHLSTGPSIERRLRLRTRRRTLGIFKQCINLRIHHNLAIGQIAITCLQVIIRKQRVLGSIRSAPRSGRMHTADRVVGCEAILIGFAPCIRQLIVSSIAVGIALGGVRSQHHAA